jgi:hypothetical protein
MPEIDLSTVESLASQLSPDDQLRLMSHLATALSGKVAASPQDHKAISWLTAGGIAPGLIGKDAQEWVDELRQGWSDRMENMSGDAK